MKKVIILAIVLIFLLSIFVVNFFGLEIALFDGTTYVSEIGLQSVSVYRQDGSESECEIREYNGEPYFVFDFIPAPEGETYTADNTDINENQVIISRIVLPTDADTKTLRFEYDDAYDDYAVFMENLNTIVILKPKKLMHVTLRAVDGSNVSTSFYVMAKEVKPAE